MGDLVTSAQLRRAAVRRHSAHRALHDLVVAAYRAGGWSVRSLAAVTGLATATVHRWVRSNG